MEKKWLKFVIYTAVIISIGLIGYLFYVNNKITNKIPKSSKLVQNCGVVSIERRICNL